MAQATTPYANVTMPWPKDRKVPAPPVGVPARTTIVSVDSHWLEPDGFADKMPAKFRDRAPRGTWTDNGYHVEADGRSLDNPALPSTLIEGVEGMWNVPARMC